jgi:hypothetical protein
LLNALTGLVDAEAAGFLAGRKLHETLQVLSTIFCMGTQRKHGDTTTRCSRYPSDRVRQPARLLTPDHLGFLKRLACYTRRRRRRECQNGAVRGGGDVVGVLAPHVKGSIEK